MKQYSKLQGVSRISFIFLCRSMRLHYMSNQYSDRVLSYYESKMLIEPECYKVNSKSEVKKHRQEDRVQSQCDIMGEMWR